MIEGFDANGSPVLGDAPQPPPAKGYVCSTCGDEGYYLPGDVEGGVVPCDDCNAAEIRKALDAYGDAERAVAVQPPCPAGDEAAQVAWAEAAAKLTDELHAARMALLHAAVRVTPAPAPLHPLADLLAELMAAAQQAQPLVQEMSFTHAEGDSFRVTVQCIGRHALAPPSPQDRLPPPFAARLPGETRNAYITRLHLDALVRDLDLLARAAEHEGQADLAQTFRNLADSEPPTHLVTTEPDQPGEWCAEPGCILRPHNPDTGHMLRKHLGLEPAPQGTEQERAVIKIRPSPTADSRYCDWSKVTKEVLLTSTQQHIRDVREGLAFLADRLKAAGQVHDHDKLTAIDAFLADFRTGFERKTWWDNHRKVNRHHLTEADGIPEDVNLVDVLDHVVDCVMAGMARTGSVRPLALPSELLQRAFQNTVALLHANVELEPAPAALGSEEGSDRG